MTEIPSVPDAYEEYLYWAHVMAAAPYDPLTRRLGSYSISRAYEQARQAWIDAEWQVNCASYQWTKDWEVRDMVIAQETGCWYWGMRMRLESLTWERRRNGEWPPGNALVLRNKGVVS